MTLSLNESIELFKPYFLSLMALVACVIINSRRKRRIEADRDTIQSILKTDELRRDLEAAKNELSELKKNPPFRFAPAIGTLANTANTAGITSAAPAGFSLKAQEPVIPNGFGKRQLSSFADSIPYGKVSGGGFSGQFGGSFISGTDTPHPVAQTKPKELMEKTDNMTVDPKQPANTSKEVEFFANLIADEMRNAICHMPLHYVQKWEMMKKAFDRNQGTLPYKVITCLSPGDFVIVGDEVGIVGNEKHEFSPCDCNKVRIKSVFSIADALNADVTCSQDPQ